MPTRILVALALLCGVAYGQPSTIAWRPPTGCTDGQAVVYHAATNRWICGSAGASYTAGDGLTLTGTDFDLAYTSDFTITADALDLSTAVTAPGSLSTVGDLYAGLDTGVGAKAFNVGRNTALTTNTQNGYSVTAYSDGNLYIDHKVHASGTVDYRYGDGAVTGADSPWFSLNTATNITTFTTPLTENGTAVLSGSITDNTIPKGSGGNLADSLLRQGTTDLAYSGDEFHFEDDQNVDGAVGWISYYGFASGTTQHRTTVIGNGKGAAVATFTGSDKSLSVTGNLSTSANLTAGDADGDSHTLRGAAAVSKTGANSNTTFDITNDAQTWRLGTYGTAGDSFYITNVTAGTDAFQMTTSNGATFTGALVVNGNVSLGDASGDAHTLTGTLTISSGSTLDADAATALVGNMNHATITASLTANTNNWAPTGLATARTIEVTGDGLGEWAITGLDATGVADGRVITIRNSSGQSMPVRHQSASSSAANRFDMIGAGDGQIGTKGAMTFEYRSGTGWRQVGHASRFHQSVHSLGLLTVNSTSTFGNHTHYVSASAPSISCGAGSPSVTGNDMRGFIVGGDGASGSGCTITFAQEWQNSTAPICVLTPVGASAHTIAPRVSSTSTTTFVVIMDAGKTVNYHCDGRN